jgi:hypothetical protein
MQMFGDAAIDHTIGRQIFAKVRHPAREAQIDHVVFDDVFVPSIGVGVGQIDDASVEGRALDGVDRAMAMLLADEIAFLFASR